MTEDQIKQFAHESGLTDKDLGDWMMDYGLCKGEILEFAKLIAKAEREECAKVCEEHLVGGSFRLRENLANAIRARGGK